MSSYYYEDLPGSLFTSSNYDENMPGTPFITSHYDEDVPGSLFSSSYGYDKIKDFGYEPNFISAWENQNSGNYFIYYSNFSLLSIV